MSTISDERLRKIQVSHSRLMGAYREALGEAERSGSRTTKVEVIRTVNDSARAAAARLRTREHGVDDLAEELEKFSQALQREDWIEKAQKGASIGGKLLAWMGVTLSGAAVLALVVNLLGTLVAIGTMAGQAVAALFLQGGAMWLFVQVLRHAYNSLKEVDLSLSPPTRPAASIIARIVDPPEKEFYAALGANRPTRTFERFEQGYSAVIILGGLLAGIVAFFFFSSFLRALSGT